MDIELLYFLLIIVTFIVCMVKFKLPTGISMMIGSVVGIIAYAITSPETFIEIPRHLIEGGFGYIDPIMTIAFAMIFMKTIETSGALDKIGVFVLEKFKRFPSLLLISLMAILFLPGMITGSSATAVVTAGALVAPILMAIGIPKNKAIGIVASGAILGMIAPPINIPVMVISDITDMPYIGFELPLLLITIPLGIFIVLFLGRKHVKEIDLEEVEKNSTIDFNINEELNWTVYIPLLVLTILLVIVNVFPQILPPLGMPLVFVLSTIPAFFVGRKTKLVDISLSALKVSVPVLSMLIGVGMLVQTLTLTGVRGMIVYYVMTMSSVSIGQHAILLYIAAAIFLPLVGTISPFASASIFGGPFVMALLITLNPIIVASSMSMLASIGDLVPPSALAGRTTVDIVEYDEPYGTVLKPLIIPIIVIIVYTTLFMVFVGQVW